MKVSELPHSLLHSLTLGMLLCLPAGADPAAGWQPLFDGKSLNEWTAAEHPDSWTVKDGCLVADGSRSHLFYSGPVGDHNFSHFEMIIEAKTEPGANSGVYFHTEYQASGRPKKGREVQINNTYLGTGNYRELKRTGSLYGIRNLSKSFVKDGEWFRLGIRVTGNRVRIHVNGSLVADYADLGAARGTIALQGHDPGSVVYFRRVDIRPLPDDTDPNQPPRASDEGYGLKKGLMDSIAKSYLPFVDYHVHLRGGMTIEKAIERQAVTGINIGVLKNIGAGWPIETDEQLREFLDSATDRPVFVGLQVNDRDWHKKHSPELLRRLDFVLGDTMIMPMPNDDSPPVKLWQADDYKIENPQAWMERYVRHNLQVLAEPITILANPTYLPPAVEGRYDELWTDARMGKIIRAAIANNVALEINARSTNPSPRFIRMAKKLGAKFSFGSNNFHGDPIDMTRCFEAIEKYGLKKKDMYVPSPKL